MGDLHLVAEEIVPLDQSTGQPVHDPVVVDLGQPWSWYIDSASTSSHLIRHDAYIWRTHEHHNGYWTLRATGSASFNDQHGTTCVTDPLDVAYDNLEVANLALSIMSCRLALIYFGPGTLYPSVSAPFSDSGGTVGTRVIMQIYSILDPTHVVRTFDTIMNESGYVVWDGSTDAGGTAAPGIYACAFHVEHQEPGWTCSSTGCERSVVGNAGKDQDDSNSPVSFGPVGVTLASASTDYKQFNLSYALNGASQQSPEPCYCGVWLYGPGFEYLGNSPSTLVSTNGTNQISVSVPDRGDGPYYFVMYGTDRSCRGKDHQQRSIQDRGAEWRAQRASIINVTSNTANGVYGPGAVIDVRVEFSGPVSVSGTPKLLLDSGTAGATATYDAADSTDRILVFTYEVQSSDHTTHLDYLSTDALTLESGASIVDTTVGGNAVRTLPAPGAAGSLGANRSIAIDASTSIAPIQTDELGFFSSLVHYCPN